MSFCGVRPALYKHKARHRRACAPIGVSPYNVGHAL